MAEAERPAAAGEISSNPSIEVIHELDGGADFTELVPDALEVGMRDIGLDDLRRWRGQERLGARQAQFRSQAVDHRHHGQPIVANRNQPQGVRGGIDFQGTVQRQDFPSQSSIRVQLR
jgi:hypothetical protein